IPNQFENAQEAARVAARGFIPAGPPGGLRSKRRGCPADRRTGRTTGPSSAMGILNHYYEKSFAYVHNDLALLDSTCALTTADFKGIVIAEVKKCVETSHVPAETVPAQFCAGPIP
ncbi:hypothetical protein KKC22_10390, partial [Myxococcota bacterium]|nr:hypothetical protein [Myxococcota bacterium]